MITNQVTISPRFPKRFAFCLLSGVVRATVPPNTAGAYLLMKGTHPIYVGRSDRCVQTRLASHPLIGSATHFVWEACPTPWQAFSLEAAWFHHLSGRPGFLNKIHPARAPNLISACPFCCTQDGLALAVALRPRRHEEGLTPKNEQVKTI